MNAKPRGPAPEAGNRRIWLQTGWLRLNFVALRADETEIAPQRVSQSGEFWVSRLVCPRRRGRLLPIERE